MVRGDGAWVLTSQLQPTEFAKIALIVMLAAFITAKGDKINQSGKLPGWVIVLFLPISGLVAANNFKFRYYSCRYSSAFVMHFCGM